MAKQKGNVVTYGLKGKIGDLLVFRQRAGLTVVSKVPAVSNKESEAQRAHRRKFQYAVVYANAVAANPDAEAAYSAKVKPGQTFRNVAVADFLRAPDIDLIDVSAYNGKIDDTIRIEVTDDFAVKEVKVVIIDSNGSIVEEGFAMQGTVGYEWIYRATVANDSLDGDRIEILASDTPGNNSSRTEEL
jgi:hypothetical protein